MLEPYFTAENLPHFSSNEAISATKAVWSEVGHTLHKRGGAGEITLVIIIVETILEFYL